MPQVRLLRRAATEGTDAASVETRASTTSSSPQEQRLAELLAELPIGEVVDDVLQALEDNPNAVLEAAPGAGKTTCLPLAILQRAKWLPEGHTILVRLLGYPQPHQPQQQTLPASTPGVSTAVVRGAAAGAAAGEVQGGARHPSRALARPLT